MAIDHSASVAELRLLLIRELKGESTRLHIPAVTHARPTLILIIIISITDVF